MSALGNKGEKNQSKFKTIDINNLYKGSSISPQKPAPVTSRQHGLQSLGKVNIRRMPPPANLPSLKSENSGSDSNLAAPPSSSGTGWTKDETPPDSPVSASSATAQPKTSHPSLATSQPMEPYSPQNPDAVQSHMLPANANLWSSVTSGSRRTGSFLDQKSTMFCEEFPQLAPGSEEKIQMPKREDENRELLHGPGPSLRPQNVGSWKDGGGRNVILPGDRSSPSLEYGGGTAADEEASGESPRPSSVGHPPLPFPGPMGMMAIRPGMPPPRGQVPLVAPANFRGMPMMPFGFRPGFPPNYPPNFIPPGMPRPPFVNPADFRFQGMYPGQPWNYVRGPNNEDGPERPLIVKEKDLEEFDKLNISDSGWAGAVIDVDYSEKLIFSDEEDADSFTDKSGKVNTDRQSSKGSTKGTDRPSQDLDRQHLDRDISVRGHREQDPSDTRTDRGNLYERQSSETSGSPITPKEIWMPGPYPRLPAPPPPNLDRRQWRPEMPFDMVGPSFQQPQFLQRPQCRPPVDGTCGDNGLEADDDEVWHQRRKQQFESMSAAIERARQRREEEERRIREEQAAASREKLRQLDEKLGKKDEKEIGGEKERTVSLKDESKMSEVLEKSGQASGTSQNRTAQRSSRAGQDEMTSSQQSVELESNDSFSRPTSSPSSPRPQPQQIAPGRAANYWPYDVRAWGPMAVPPRYMMDPRYVWQLQHGGMPMMMPGRRPASGESTVEGRDEAQDSPDVASRQLWMDQSAYAGQYEQQMMRAGYCGMIPAEYNQKDFELVDTRFQGFYPEDDSRPRSRPNDDTQRPVAADTGSKMEPSRAAVGASHREHYSSTVQQQDSSRQSSNRSLNEDEKLPKKEPERQNAHHKKSRKDRGKGQPSAGVGRSQAEPGTVDSSRPIGELPGLGRASDADQAVSSASSSSSVALKRTHSIASNCSSVASYERKTDSPKELGSLPVEKLNPNQQSQKNFNRDSKKSGRNIKSKDSQSDISLREEFGRLSIGNSSEPSGKLESRQVNSASDKTVRVDEKDRDISKVNGNPDRPPAKRMKDGGRPYRRRKDEHDPERSRVNISSREFVRGGRGSRMRGSAHGRGRGYADDRGGYSEPKSEGGSYKSDANDMNMDYGTGELSSRAVKNAGSGKARGESNVSETFAQQHESSLAAGKSPANERSNEIPPGAADNSFSRRSYGGQRIDRAPNQKSDFPPASRSDGPDRQMEPSNRGHRARNSGGRTRDTGRPQGQPRPSDERTASQQLHGTQADQSTGVVNKDDAHQGPEWVAEPARQTGSQRGQGNRRRGARRGPPATSSVDGTAETAGQTTEVTDGTDKERKVDTRPNRTPRAAVTPRTDGNGSRSDEQSRRNGGQPRDVNARRRRENGAKKQQPSSGEQSAVAASGTHEEWETASESSDVLRGSSRPHLNNDRDRETASRRDNKKSFSSQRPSTGRRGGRRNEPHASVSQSDVQSRDSAVINTTTNVNQANGNAASGSSASATDVKVGGLANSGSNGTAHLVYRLDQVLYDDPHGIEQLFARHYRNHSCEVENTFNSAPGMSLGSGVQKADNNDLTYAATSSKTGLSRQKFCQNLSKQQLNMWPFAPALTIPDQTLDMVGLVMAHGTGDRHDSGVDLSDLPNSSGCSSPLDDVIESSFSDRRFDVSSQSSDAHMSASGNNQGLKFTSMWHVDDIFSRQPSDKTDVWSCNAENQLNTVDGRVKTKFQLPSHFGTLINTLPERVKQDAPCSERSPLPCDGIVAAGIIGSHRGNHRNHGICASSTQSSTYTSVCDTNGGTNLPHVDPHLPSCEVHKSKNLSVDTVDKNEHNADAKLHKL